MANPAKTRDSARQPAHRKPSVVKHPHPDLDTPSVSLRSYIDMMFEGVNKRIDLVVQMIDTLRQDMNTRLEELNNRLDWMNKTNLTIWLFSMSVVGVAFMYLLGQLNQIKEQNAAILEQNAAILLALGKLGG